MSRVNQENPLSLRVKSLHSPSGAVFLELTLFIVVAFFLLGGAIDYSLAFFERSVMSDAARMASRSIARMSNCTEVDAWSPEITRPCSEDNLALFAQERYAHALRRARLWMQQNNFSPDNYEYSARTVAVSEEGGDIEYNIVQVEIETRNYAGRFFFLPGFAFRNCTYAQAPIEGVSLSGLHGSTTFAVGVVQLCG